MDLQGKYKPTTAIFIFSVIMFLAFTIAQIVQAVFFIPYVDFQELLESNGQMNVLKLMPANMLLLSIGASSAVMFIGGPLLYLKIVKQKVWSISKNDKVYIASFFMTLLLIVGFMPLNSFIFEMNSKIPFPQFLIDMENQMAEVTKSIMVFNNLFAVAIGVFVIGVLAGVGEELTFRGIFQNLFNKLFSNHHVGIWVTALIFTTIHMQFLGFFPRMILGALFGYIYYWSGNLVLAMFAHFFNNGFTVVMVHLYNIKVISIDLETDEGMPWHMVLSSVVFTSIIWYLLFKSFKDKPNLA